MKKLITIVCALLLFASVANAELTIKETTHKVYGYMDGQTEVKTNLVSISIIENLGIEDLRRFGQHEKVLYLDDKGWHTASPSYFSYMAPPNVLESYNVPLSSNDVLSIAINRGHRISTPLSAIEFEELKEKAKQSIEIMIQEDYQSIINQENAPEIIEIKKDVLPIME